MWPAQDIYPEVYPDSTLTVADKYLPSSFEVWHLDSWPKDAVHFYPPSEGQLDPCLLLCAAPLGLRHGPGTGSNRASFPAQTRVLATGCDTSQNPRGLLGEMVKCSVTGVGWLNQKLPALNYCTKDSGKERGGGPGLLHTHMVQLAVYQAALETFSGSLEEPVISCHFSSHIGQSCGLRCEQAVPKFLAFQAPTSSAQAVTGCPSEVATRRAVQTLLPSGAPLRAPTPGFLAGRG